MTPARPVRTDRDRTSADARAAGGRQPRQPPGSESGRLPPLPRGFRIELDADTRQLPDGSLFGGSPARVMRLTAAGARALAELQAGPARSAAAGALARRLTEAGLAHPVPPPNSAPAAPSVTVVIPVRDRAEMLDRCLTAAGGHYPVVVVDDGSADPWSIATVAARHGALLRRRDRAGGPAAARNTGLDGVDTDVVAFLDSDCVPAPGWVRALAAHLEDPLVGAVAPRITGLEDQPGGRPPASVPAAPLAARRTSAVRYAAACGSLDLGSRPALVLPGSRVSYVPTAALLVRRAALLAALAAVTDDSERAEVFDPALRYGEDVDLVWRLHRAGWRIRYEPGVEVAHDGPGTWTSLLARRFSYGTSAAPLARRHPRNMAPLVLQPWPATAAVALLARKPSLALAATVAGWLDLTSLVRRAGVPADGAAAATVTAIRQTWLGLGRYATQFAGPLLCAALAAPGGASGARRWGRRAAAASLLLGPALNAYAERRPEMDPVTFALAHIADDVCYGAGVWAGCVRERTLLPVRPAISWRPLRVAGARRGTATGPGKTPATAAAAAAATDNLTQRPTVRQHA